MADLRAYGLTVDGAKAAKLARRVSRRFGQCRRYRGILEHARIALDTWAVGESADPWGGDPAPAFDTAAQRALFVARLRGGVNSSAIAAIIDGTRR